jgi:hypothetical protein
MKKFLTLFVCALSITALTISCDNYMSRKFGGSTTINLEKGQKLVEATWKENSLWYLTEPMDSDYVPKTKTFKEDSNFGVLEGTVTFVESR